MTSLAKLVLAIGLLSASPIALAQGLTAVQPLPGYICLRLNLTHDQAMDRSLQIPVFEEPSSSSAKIGNASAVIMANAPAQIQNGFQKILFPDGRPAWIAVSWLMPFATRDFPNSHCTPYLMSNGKPGFKTSLN